MKWSANSAWLAMSARDSKTSSRGRSIVISVTSGSTRPRSLRGGADPQPEGLPAFGVVDGLRADRRRASAWAAQLAHDDPARVDVHLLADERRAAAVGAEAAAGRACCGPHGCGLAAEG